jgi:hypothetical protein
MELNDHLRQMLKELGQAINESISGSGRVHDSIQRIRDEGYNLYMVLDAKVGVNKHEGRNGSRGRSSAARGENASPIQERAAFRINVKDLRFLKSVGIDPTRKVRNRRTPNARVVRLTRRPRALKGG